MSFANLPLIATLLGAAVLAGLLYVLQRLRVRHKEQTVVTTLFWREAVEETRARVLIRRFRHPWAYVLILLIATLIWLSTAEPHLTVAKNKEFVVVLDGSAAVGRANWFEQAKQKVEQLCRSLPESRRTVVLSQATTKTLLGQSENIELLRQRWQDVKPAASPNQVEKHLRQLVARHDADTQQTTFLVVSSRATSDAFNREFEKVKGAKVQFVPITDSVANDNVGITSLGIAPAMSGQWDKLDVLVEVMGSTDRPQLEVSLDGQALKAAAIEDTNKGSRFRFADIKANGGKFLARLASDNFEMDNVATLKLPNRTRIRVAISPGVPVAIATRFHQLFAADDALETDNTSPEVVIRKVGEPFGGNATALELARTGSQSDAFLVSHDNVDEEANTLLSRSLHNLGVDQIDATGLAQQTGQKIALGVDRQPQRRVRVWQSLLSDQFNFVSSATFPIFAGRSIRWLAGRRPVTPTFAAGTTVSNHKGTFQFGERKLETGGVSFVPPEAGTFIADGGETIDVSLLDEKATVLPPFDKKSVSKGPNTWSGNVLSLIGMLAFVLLVAEWFSYQKGSIP